ncbi:MAG: hypothetical protein IKA87_08565 [Lentisphaeria bacterium]|nr:hypothetical protein [Lentisphaeria bacterium]
MKLISVILAFFCVLTLSADAVITIKGKAKRTSIRIVAKSGLTANINKLSNSTEVKVSTKKDYQTLKMVFRVLKDDEYSFSIGGEYSKDSGGAGRQFFAWIDCNLFKVNGKELIGPKAEKGGVKNMTVAQTKSVKGTAKLKKGQKLELEVSLRNTPRSESRKRSEEANMTDKQKKRLARKEAREKARASRRAEEEKKRMEWEKSVKVEKPRTSSRYAMFQKSQSSAASKSKSVPEPQSKSVPENNDGADE